MTAVADGHVVEINYTLTNNKGDVIDSSNGTEPMTFIQGKENIIPGLEKEMAGKKVGDSFKVTVGPEDGYGPRYEEMIQSIPKEQFGPDAPNIQVGMQFQLEGSNGQEVLVTAIEVREKEVVLDGNHPLAGETLHFDVEVISLREATEEELAKGSLKDCSDNGCC